MLSSNVTYTPRPRPPARRRSTPLKRGSSPPPSYAATLTPDRTSEIPTILGSPMVATFQNLAWGEELSSVAETDKDWMNERSREELEELLGKAGSLIKDRENDLGLASAVCKSLYDNNLALKSKHQALLARLPSSPSPSPSPEPFTRPSSRYNISLSRSVTGHDSPILSKSQIRKISVSSADICHLEDQNAELLDKLEKLEAQSEKTDQAGRRELKRLEKEILHLREELEKTQAKSEELESKHKAELVSKADEVFRQREERHAKLKAMRNLGARNGSPDSENEVQNFAPRGSSFGGPSAGFPFAGSTEALLNPPPVHPEPSVISQLLEKIKELEQANSKIIAHQAETTEQLNAMQRETEQITRVYDCFADGQITEADGHSDDGRPHDQTIRFRTLQQNLGVQLADAERQDNGGNTLGIITAPKARKSVVGLFDTLEQAAAVSGLPSPPNLVGQDLRNSMSNGGLISPAPSSYGLPSPTSMHGGAGLTLGDELAGELDGFNSKASYGHARSGSLWDLMKASSSTSHTPTHSLEVPTISAEPTQQTPPRPYPPSLGRAPLRLSVEPPTPEKFGSLGRQRSERMAETLRLRTNHWVNKRFQESPSRPSKTEAADDDNHDEDEDTQDLQRPLTPLSLRLTSAFDAAVQNVKQATDTSVLTLDEELDAAAQGAVTTRPKQEMQQPRGLGAILLEVWLWLQFGIVVLFFLWAMAKRGPKSVLGDPGQRRAVSSSSARSS